MPHKTHHIQSMYYQSNQWMLSNVSVWWQNVVTMMYSLQWGIASYHLAVRCCQVLLTAGSIGTKNWRDRSARHGPLHDKLYSAQGKFGMFWCKKNRKNRGKIVAAWKYHVLDRNLCQRASNLWFETFHDTFSLWMWVSLTAEGNHMC